MNSTTGKYCSATVISLCVVLYTISSCLEPIEYFICNVQDVARVEYMTKNFFLAGKVGDLAIQCAGKLGEGY